MLWSVVGGFALATGAYAGGGSGQAEVKMMDTDGDGSISATEHAAGAKQMFAKMDADGDGIVTARGNGRGPQGHADGAEEARPVGHASASRLGKSDRIDKSAAAKIKMIDTDGDGTITAAEHEAGAKKMFGKMDKDGNGKLSAAEVQAGHDRMVTAEDQ